MNVSHVTGSYKNPDVVSIFQGEFQAFFFSFPPNISVLRKASTYIQNLQGQNQSDVREGREDIHGIFWKQNKVQYVAIY